jgi:hypothetical protein
MMRSGLRKDLFLWLAAAALVLGAVAGCGGGEAATTPDTTQTTPSASPELAPAQLGPPPSPAQIDPTELTVIDEWRGRSRSRNTPAPSGWRLWEKA